ncbi:MAG: glycosyltransferase [Oscillospiraceae bacterium]|nr:glycosyltransferase [Oscillospiraceae bacterium]
MPIISVIVCIYNVEHYLNNCVASILNQTFKDIEVILVDDGSTDGSVEICDTIAESDSRVKVLHIVNSGMSIARNKGMEIATGEFMTFSDSDDIIDKDAYETMYDIIIKNDSDLVICGYNADVKKDDKIIVSRKMAPHNAVITEKQQLLNKFIEVKSIHVFDAVWNKLFRANIIRNNSIIMPEGEIFEDTEFVLRFLAYTSKVTLCSSCFYHYVQRIGSVTKSFNPQKLIFLKKRRESIAKYLFDDGKPSGELGAFCSMFYLKSVYSFFIDLFFPRSKRGIQEIRNIIRNELKERDFSEALIDANGAGLGNKLTVLIAKTHNITLTYLYSKFVYLLKYKAQSLYWRIK